MGFNVLRASQCGPPNQFREAVKTTLYVISEFVEWFSKKSRRVPNVVLERFLATPFCVSSGVKVHEKVLAFSDAFEIVILALWQGG